MKRKVFLLLALGCALAMTAAPAFALKEGTVFSPQIVEADGISGQDTSSGSGVKTAHIQDGAVTGAKIADGTISESKIAGYISQNKINSDGLNADTVDNFHASDFAPFLHDHSGQYQGKYENLIVVAKSGGDFSDPVTAINSVTNASVANPYLIKIMPGIYNITSTLTMKSYVDIEGSGTGITVIQGSVDSWFGLVHGADDAAISKLSLVNNLPPSATWSTCVSCNGVSPTISDLDITVTGSQVSKGIEITNSSPIISNCTIYSGSGQNTNYGILINNAKPFLSGIKIFVSGPGIINQGIFANNGSELTAENLLVTVEEGTYSNRATFCELSTCKIKNSELFAKGGTYARGAEVNNAYFYMNNVNAEATDALTNQGVSIFHLTYSNPPSSAPEEKVVITNSQITGSSSSVSSAAPFLAIVNTQLGGGAPQSTGGIIKCSGNYNVNFDQVNCQ